MNINDAFISIQGEGIFTGTPAFFIRFQGCPIRCAFCDTKESWDPGETACSPREILEWLKAKKKKYPKINHVILTGGEPFYGENGAALPALINGLIAKGYFCQVETSGTLLPPNFFGAIKKPSNLLITISPKMRMPQSERFLPVHSEFFLKTDLGHTDFASLELKFLVDGSPASIQRIDNFFLEHEVARARPISIQPIDSGTKDLALEQAIDIVKKRGWHLSCQLHKMIGIK